jgi:NHL repeat/Immunoglobulin I-set domain
VNVPVPPPTAAPQITTQPADQTLSANATAAFTAAASGSPVPAITWNAGTGQPLPGSGTYADGNCSFDYSAQGGTLSLSRATLDCIGLVFYAVASNSAGSVSTREARLLGQTATALLLAAQPGSPGAVDGTLAQARFATPNYLAVSTSGQVAVADFANHAVRLVTAGAVSTLAGALGQPGHADGAGTQARFNGLGGLAYDSAGNLFVADWDNHVIRRVTPAGVVSTFAGTAGAAGSDDGTGAAARLRNPNGLAIDSADNVYVADWGNHTIRRITPAGVVSTLAGSAGQSGSADGSGAAARFSMPSGLALLGPGRLVVADQGNHTLRSITTAGVVATLAGTAGSPGHVDGAAGSARFEQPAWVAASADGRVFVVSGAGDTLRRVALDGSVETLVGVPGGASAVVLGANPRLHNARGLWVDPAGTELLLVADHALLRIVLP